LSSNFKILIIDNYYNIILIFFVYFLYIKKIIAKATLRRSHLYQNQELWNWREYSSGSKKF